MLNMPPVCNFVISGATCLRIVWYYVYFLEIIFNVVLNDVVDVCQKVCDSVIFQRIIFVSISGRLLLSSWYGKEYLSNWYCTIMFFLLFHLGHKDKCLPVSPSNNPLFSTLNWTNFVLFVSCTRKDF